MPDFAPGARILPKAFIVQLNPTTSELMECGLRYDVELPSGVVVHDREHWWHELRTDRSHVGMADTLHRIALACVFDLAGRHDLEHRPQPKEEAPA